MWEVVLGYPVRTTGYFSAARENMYAKTQVCFLHYNARPRSPGFALRHQATKGNQKSGGGVGQGRGRCGSWLTHSPPPPPSSADRRPPTRLGFGLLLLTKKRGGGGSIASLSHFLVVHAFAR